jgi:hypothetical protein
MRQNGVRSNVRFPYSKGTKGKRVKAKQGYYAREDESIGMRLGAGKATAAHPKKAAAERDLSYGKWGKRSRDWWWTYGPIRRTRSC